MAEVINARTLRDAGSEGRALAEILIDAVKEAISGFPDSTPQQRGAIARIVANHVGAYAEEEQA